MSVFFRQNKDGSRRYYVRREFRAKEYIWPKRGEGPWRNRWEAKEREAEVERAIADGTFEHKFGERRDRTLSEALDAYLDTGGPNRPWSRATRDSYREKADALLEWKFLEGHPLAGTALGDFALGALIDRRTGDSYLQDFREHRRKEGVTDRTINRQVTLLRGACRYATRLWRLPKNPALDLRTVNERSNQPMDSYPDAELVENVLIPQLRDFHDERSPYAYSMFLVAYDCGLRAKDVKELKPERCDFERGVLVVPTSKTGNIAMPPMSERVRDALEDLVERNGDTGWLFPNPKTGRPYLKGPTRVWRRLMAEIPGLSGFRAFHDWRHSFTSRASEAGVPEAVIAAWRGDENTAMIARYRHMRPDAVDQWAGALHERDQAYRNGRLVNLQSKRDRTRNVSRNVSKSDGEEIAAND